MTAPLLSVQDLKVHFDVTRKGLFGGPTAVVKAVDGVAYRAAWRREDEGPAAEASRRARAAEEDWQRRRAFALLARSGA